MQKFSLSIILLLLVPTLYFSSCAEDENKDDNESPKIVYAHINVNDTLYVTDTVYSKQEVTLKLNDSLSLNHEIDTLTIGKWVYVNAEFRDDKSLSTFKVETTLRYKSKAGTGDDKTLDTLFVKLGRNIFGKDTIQVAQNRLMQIPDTITRKYNNIPVKMGLVPNDYQFKVVCLDASGKRDSIQFPVRLLFRKTIYNDRFK
ncbi:MAG: hypothetical protein ACK5KT_02770 [Dysgonomonas sp.]